MAFNPSRSKIAATILIASASASVTLQMEAFNRLMEKVGGTGNISGPKKGYFTGKFIDDANQDNKEKIVSYLLGTAPVGDKLDAVRLCVSAGRLDYLKQLPLEKVQNKKLESAIASALKRDGAGSEFHGKTTPFA